MRLLVDTRPQIQQEVPMTESSFRLLALMIMLPLLLIVALAVAVAGCDQPTLPPSPPQVLAPTGVGQVFTGGFGSSSEMS
jgi:hypothetical protein